MRVSDIMGFERGKPVIVLALSVSSCYEDKSVPMPLFPGGCLRGGGKGGRGRWSRREKRGKGGIETDVQSGGKEGGNR